MRRKLLINSESGTLNVDTVGLGHVATVVGRAYLVNIFYGLLLEKLRSKFISITHEENVLEIGSRGMTQSSVCDIG